MTQSSLEFDPAKSAAKRDRGIAIASSNNETLEKAREVARWLGRDGKPVTIDDVTKAMAVYGFTPAQLGNAAGSIFRDGAWFCCGWRNSERVSSHSRPVRIWVLK